MPNSITIKAALARELRFPVAPELPDDADIGVSPIIEFQEKYLREKRRKQLEKIRERTNAQKATTPHHC